MNSTLAQAEAWIMAKRDVKWVPYHHILGSGEVFVMERIHGNEAWQEWQRWSAMFIFRAHGRPEVFERVQMPLMARAKFWKDPLAAFRPEGAMEKAMVSYKQQTGKPLVSGMYRQVPPRTCQDDDWNLARSISQRTLQLLRICSELWRILRDTELTPAQKCTAMADEVI